MNTRQLDQNVVSAALRREPDIPPVLHDHKVGGLWLVVGTRTAKWQLSYIARGRTPEGKRPPRRQMIIGDVAALSLHQARAEALALKVEIARGGDPYLARKTGRDATIDARINPPATLASVIGDYETALGRRTRPSPSTKRQEVAYARKALDLMGLANLPVDRLDTAKVRALLRETKASPSEIVHLYGSIRRFADWLVEEAFLDINPCAAIPRAAKPRLRSRDYVPSLTELQALWRAAHDEAEVVRDVIHFLMFTALRLREATEMKWGEVDLRSDWLRVSASRMKAGAVHEVPLSDEAQAILRRRLGDRSPDPGDLVFPSRSGAPLDGWSRVFRRLRKAIGQTKPEKPADPTRRPDVISAHDFRRAFGTHLSGQFDEALLNLLLAHMPPSRLGSGKSYFLAARLPERPKVMQAWADTLLGRKPVENPVINILPFVGAR